MNSIKATKLYTGTGILENIWLNFEKEKIYSLTAKPSGNDIGHFPVITPAFIDPHSHIGMCREGEPATEDEANEQLDSFTALADALDSVQMDDAGFKNSVENGVLYSCVVPGSGNIVGGLSAVIRNYAQNTNEALISRAGIKAAFGYNPMSTRDWKGSRPYTRMGCLALLRSEFREIMQKMLQKKKKSDDPLNPRQKVLKDILDRKARLRVHVHKSDDIAALLRFVDEFKLDVTVEHACDVHDLETFKILAKRRIPVIYGPVDCFGYKVELKHASPKNIKFLLESGVEYGLMSDHPVILQGNLLLCLRYFLRFGLTKSEAIQILTKKNAGLIGLDNVLGELSKDKWASFICWNGDPFELSSYPAAVYGEGRKIYQT